MATVPSNAQFRADTTGVTVEQLGSEQTNARAAFFTMEDIAESTQPTTDNTFFGLDAFGSNVGGEWNTAIGYQALSENISGNYNTAVGGDALRDNTVGQNNVAVGVASLRLSTTGVHNVGVGVTTFINTIDGSDNAAIGQAAGYSNVSGDENTYIGNRAGVSVVNGNGNTFLGSKTGEGPFFSGSNTGDNNIVIGRWSDHKNFDKTICLGIEVEATQDSQLFVGSNFFPVGTIAAYTGAAAETWEVVINGVTKKIMLAP